MDNLHPVIAAALAGIAPPPQPRSRRLMSVTPDSIHPELEPVVAYAQELANYHRQARAVVSIPEGSAAYRMGYRYTSIPEDELACYVTGGAGHILTCNPEPKA